MGNIEGTGMMKYDRCSLAVAYRSQSNLRGRRTKRSGWLSMMKERLDDFEVMTALVPYRIG